ncbi:MAG: FkbM family methyltransferase, partial [Pseudomonadota bacterium]
PGLSKNMADGAKIWAFEPNPRSYQHARETIKLNGIENVTLTHAAVSEASGTVQLRTHSSAGEELGGRSHVRAGIEGDDGFVSVDSVRLDEVVPKDRNISILQLDVEGHELSAVLGAGGIVNRCKPILILEAFERKRWIRRQFGSLGYELLGSVHGNHIYAVEGADVDLELRA